MKIQLLPRHTEQLTSGRYLLEERINAWAIAGHVLRNLTVVSALARVKRMNEKSELGGGAGTGQADVGM